MPRLSAFLVVASLVTSSCSGGTGAKQAGLLAGNSAVGGSRGVEAGAAAVGGAEMRGAGALASAASGAGGSGASAGNQADAGARASAGAGGMVAGSGGSAAGRAAADGGRSAGASAGTPAPPLPSLRIYSDTTSIEFTPALLAAQSLYGGMASVQSGGIANLFTAGQADLATNAETQALRQSVQHPNLRIVFSVTETFYRIVANRSAGITQLADLRGKKVGTVTNTSAHYYLEKMLRSVGMSTADVTLVSAFPLTRLPQLLQSKQVDAVTSWEPEPQNAADALGANAIEFQDRAVYREIVNLHTTAEQLNDPDKRRAIVAFVRVLMHAAEQFQNRPESVWPLVSGAIGYDQSLLAKVWHNERFPGVLVADLLDVLVEEEAWLAQQSARTARTRAQLATLIDDSVLKEALAAP